MSMELNNKLTTLAHLKSAMESAKGYIDQQDAVLSGQIADVIADVEAMDAAALRGVKVNGNLLTITDKIAELMIETGTENGTINVGGAAVAVAGLKKLAFLDEITEDEFSDALKVSFAAKAEQADLEAMGVRVTAIEEAGYQTAEQVEAIAKAAVAASGHAKFVEAESDPTAEGFVGEDNVMYLWPAADGDGYSIYAKIGDEMKLMGHTKVDLSGYSTTEQMTAAISAAIEGLKIGDYAKLVDLNAAVERITALETALANVYTKEEAEAKFMDEGEAQAIADAAADEAAAGALSEAKTYADGAAADAVAAAVATDEEFAAAMNSVWTPNN
ncbi:MAG: hypothetical protein IJ955_08685 [Oscillospiraceae bacterium]|nr:hypothetical protein [Oscillospiraceae bacterium]